MTEEAAPRLAALERKLRDPKFKTFNDPLTRILNATSTLLSEMCLQVVYYSTLISKLRDKDVMLGPLLARDDSAISQADLSKLNDSDPLSVLKLRLKLTVDAIYEDQKKKNRDEERAKKQALDNASKSTSSLEKALQKDAKACGLLPDSTTQS